jgi:hypothetical protein
MLFGTDSKPFVSFISKKCDFMTIGAKMNMRLYNHQSVVRTSQDEFIFAGGVNHLFNHVTSKAFKYNIRLNKYTKMNPLIYRRFFAKLISVRGRIFMVGGRDYGQDKDAILNKCEEYNEESQKWEVVGDLNYPRCNFSVTVHNQEVYIFGGITKDSSLLEIIETFSFQKNRWEVLGLYLTPGIYGNLSFVINDDIYILGGEKNANNGYVFSLDISNGSDMGDVFSFPSVHKNTLAKPILLTDKIMILGGFLSAPLCFDFKTKNMKYVFGNSKEKQLIKHLEGITYETFNLTRCSYASPM